MHLNCPHCQNPFEVVVEDKVEEILCPSCGSSIQLDPDRTETFLPEKSPRRLAKFEFLEELGVGGYGTVYIARDTELDRIVAIKVPRAGNLATPEDVDRFLREARAVAQLKHSSIVSVHDAVQSDGTCYLVSEYVPGETLADRLQRTRLSFREAAELMAQVADALGGHKRWATKGGATKGPQKVATKGVRNLFRGLSGPTCQKKVPDTFSAPFSALFGAPASSRSTTPSRATARATWLASTCQAKLSRTGCKEHGATKGVRNLFRGLSGPTCQKKVPDTFSAPRVLHLNFHVGIEVCLFHHYGEFHVQATSILVCIRRLRLIL